MAQASGSLRSPLPALSDEQRAWRWKILTATYCGYAGFYLTRKTFSICKTSIADEFHWELGSTAHIWTAFLIAYMLGQFLNGLIGKQWGPRALLLGGLGLSILCNIVFGFTNSFATFMSFMFFNGMVQAAGWPGAVGGVANWLRREERGAIMGVWSTSYMVGNIVVKSMGAMLLASYGWRWSFWGCTLLAFAVWWLVYFWQRNKPEDVGLMPILAHEASDIKIDTAAMESKPAWNTYVELLGNPVILAMGLSYFCIKFLRYALDSWLPTFFEIMKLPKDQASYYTIGFDLAGMAGAILAGWALDRHFKGKWAKLCLYMAIGMILGYLAVLAFPGRTLAQAFCFAFVGLMIYGPDTLLCGAAAVQVAGERNGVAVAGIVNGMGSLGPVIQEEVIGWLFKGVPKDDYSAAILSANYLSLAMSVLFAGLMVMTLWRIGQTERRSAA